MRRRIKLTPKRKEHLLYLCRAAAFYQAEFWEAGYEIERLLKEGADCFEWEVFQRFFELETIFSRKNLYDSELRLYLKGLPSVGSDGPIFDRAISANTRAQLQKQLRKANWTNKELRRIATLIARVIGDKPESTFGWCCELVWLDGEGYLVTSLDIDELVLGKKSRRSRAATEGGRSSEVNPYPSDFEVKWAIDSAGGVRYLN